MICKRGSVSVGGSWLMVAFFFLGAAAGILNAYRAASGMDDSVGLGAAQRRRDEKKRRG